ncbi:hypothetical protein TNCV_567731 [Trichonephila clavipes]|nr:hypothetical protein TNCV_567731 [Trichonephila clavipes]
MTGDLFKNWDQLDAILDNPFVMNSVRWHEGHSEHVLQTTNACGRLWPMRRRVNLTSVLRIGIKPAQPGLKSAVYGRTGT